MNRSFIRACALVALGTAAVGACGSGGLSKPEFVAKADAICAEAAQKTKAIGTPQNAQQVPAFVEKVIPLARVELAKLRALAPPDVDKAKVKELLDTFAAEIPMIQGLSAAVKANDGARFNQVGTQLDAQEKKANDLANAYGLKECGKGT